MKDNRKRAKAMPILTTFAVIIASINLAFAIIKRLPLWPHVTILFCNIIVFGCSIIENKSHKNNNDNRDK